MVVIQAIAALYRVDRIAWARVHPDIIGETTARRTAITGLSMVIAPFGGLIAVPALAIHTEWSSLVALRQLPSKLKEPDTQFYY